MMTGLLQDVRYGLRMLRKRPGFTAVAVITLALGIGANTTIFNSVNAMLLRPFPFPRLDRMVTIWETLPRQNDNHLSPAPANFRDWSEQSTQFSQLAAVRGWDANLTGGNVAEHVEGSQVTADFFSLLGMSPQLGRNIGSADFQGGVAPVVVISNGFWQQHLGADPALVGRQLLLNGRKFTVIGITSPDFDFPTGSKVWTPLDLNGPAKEDRESHYLTVFGRLKDSVSISQAQAKLETIAASLGQQHPRTNAGHGVNVKNTVEDVTYGSQQFLMMLMGAAVFVLLLACANVANLQLARASGRQKEIALRAALGASRWQVGRQLLVESLLLALLGSAAALLLSAWGINLLRRSLPPFIVEHVAGLKHLHLDLRVFWFTLLLAIVTGIVAGLAPAWHFSRPNVNDTLKEGTRGGSASASGRRLRTLLVISEIALSLVLLVGAGLMVKGFRTLTTKDMGFDRNHVLTFHVVLPDAKYRDKDRIRGYYEQVLRNIQALPGVESAACVTSLPSGWTWNWTEFTAEGRPPAAPGERPSVISQIVTPGLFPALRVPLRQGRLLSDQDGPNAPPVAVISETMAHQNWPDQNPLGKHIQMGRPEAAQPLRTIVGVVGEVQPVPLDHDPAPTAYIPFAQQPESATAFVVRTSGDPLTLAGSVSKQLRDVDADQPAYDMRSLEQVVSDGLSGIESSANMMLIFAACALTLAAAGIFAVMAYSVTQRTHEIGVRVALGARRLDVLRLVVGGALKMAMIGLSIGLVLALLLTRALSGALFGVVQIDVVTFALLTSLLALVAALAAYIPARWAMNVDPMVALRYE
ncbi:MAG: ABC transporter permease [Acidobacteriia bacterium]|nr:ABC transporter permease [Terriglobia bacterium]